MVDVYHEALLPTPPSFPCALQPPLTRRHDEWKTKELDGVRLLYFLLLRAVQAIKLFLYVVPPFTPHP